MKRIEAYQCDDCAMTSIHKSSVSRHEANVCRKNTDRIMCLNCVHWFDNGEDDNGEVGPYRNSWIDAGCNKEHPVDYECRNFNTDCEDFKPGGRVIESAIVKREVV